MSEEDIWQQGYDDGYAHAESDSNDILKNKLKRLIRFVQLAEASSGESIKMKIIKEINKLTESGDLK